MPGSGKQGVSVSFLGDSDGGTTLLHLLHAGLVCSAVVGVKLYRNTRHHHHHHQQHQQQSRSGTVSSSGSIAGDSLAVCLEQPTTSTSDVEAQLAAARCELVAKDEQLRALQQQVAEQRCKQSEEVLQLRSRLRAAQAEVLAAGQRCREATERMARTACDLAVTETELRAQKAQMAHASQQLQEMQTRLEATEGELGLSRSQNLMMQREVALMRRQLREAGEQLEGHLAARAVAGWRGADSMLETAWE